MTEKISTNLERDIYEVGALFGRYEQADAALKRVIALAKLGEEYGNTRVKIDCEKDRTKFSEEKYQEFLNKESLVKKSNLHKVVEEFLDYWFSDSEEDIEDYLAALEAEMKDEADEVFVGTDDRKSTRLNSS